jgi:hypothetical protein
MVCLYKCLKFIFVSLPQIHIRAQCNNRLPVRCCGALPSRCCLTSRSKLQMQMELSHRLVSALAFNFLLFFKRQPYVMNEPIGWLIFGHKLLCREREDAHSDLPVCLDEVRSRVIWEAIKIACVQQVGEMLSLKQLWVWLSTFCPGGSAPAAIQVVQSPEYSGSDLNGASTRYLFLPCAQAARMLRVFRPCNYPALRRPLRRVVDARRSLPIPPSPPLPPLPILQTIYRSLPFRLSTSLAAACSSRGCSSSL